MRSAAERRLRALWRADSAPLPVTASRLTPTKMTARTAVTKLTMGWRRLRAVRTGKGVTTALAGLAADCGSDPSRVDAAARLVPRRLSCQYSFSPVGTDSSLIARGLKQPCLQSCSSASAYRCNRTRSCHHHRGHHRTDRRLLRGPRVAQSWSPSAFDHEVAHASSVTMLVPHIATGGGKCPHV